MNKPVNSSVSVENKEQREGATPGFCVVDASVWVARLVQADVFHQSVKAWMEGQRAEGVVFLSPGLLLAEVGGAISRRTGEPQLGRDAIASLERLPVLKLVEMDQSLVRDAAWLAADLGLRGADSFYVALAARLKVRLVTLDEDQKSRAFPLVEVFSF